MAIETRNPARTKPTRAPGAETADGNIMAIRKTVTTTKQTATMPTGYRFVLLKNAGANTILFNFGSDSTSNYFSAVAGETIPVPLQIVSGTAVNYVVLSGTSILELIIWG